MVQKANCFSFLGISTSSLFEMILPQTPLALRCQPARWERHPITKKHELTCFVTGWGKEPRQKLHNMLPKAFSSFCVDIKKSKPVSSILYEPSAQNVKHTRAPKHEAALAERCLFLWLYRMFGGVWAGCVVFFCFSLGLSQVKVFVDCRFTCFKCFFDLPVALHALLVYLRVFSCRKRQRT